MTVSAGNAVFGTPQVADDQYVVGNACSTTNIISPGDYVIWSGTGIAAAEDAQAYYKASGIGIAMDRNPAYDNAGRSVVNSALLIATRGIFRVSGNHSGQILNGVLAYPATTGSGVNAGSGITGLGAKWQTGLPAAGSGATAVAFVSGVAQVIACYPALGPAGTGQWDIRLWSRNADYY